MLRVDPGQATAWHRLGVVACRQGRLEEGSELFRKAVQVQTDFVLAWMDLGAALRELSDTAGAVDCFDRVLAIDPLNADAHNSRGEALSAQRRHNDALKSYEAAIRLKPLDPRAHNNAGGALLEMGQYQTALERLDAALALRPGYASAIANRGSALHGLGRFAESIAQFDHALAIAPGYAEARFNRGLTLLLLGQFRDGWRDYEARLDARHPQEKREFMQPRWHGGFDLNGKTILLHAEQGLGDTLQLCRYVPLTALRAARVVLEAPRELVSLLRTLAGAASVISSGDPLPDFDFHCPLPSLPGAFGTDLSDIPAGADYLRPDRKRVEHWHARLGSKGARPRIGLAWSGSRLLKNDRNRSLPLRLLLDALDGVDAEFISLQKDVREGDLDALARRNSVRPLGTELEDFADTAALTSLLDLVISVDTAVAHLAGALAVPTWIMLPWVPDWRWLLHRSDSPWYPTVRLWRQTAPGDWLSLLVDLRAELSTLALSSGPMRRSLPHVADSLRKDP
jgi:Tfp pilus assembly protein PilF